MSLYYPAEQSWLNQPLYLVLCIPNYYRPAHRVSVSSVTTAPGGDEDVDEFIDEVLDE